jgi:hypothetical protein
MRMFLRHILALAFLVFVLPEFAHACSCATLGPQPCRLLKESSDIFIGTVVDVENPPNPDAKVGDSGVSGYTFAVSETFAGVSKGEVVVYSGRGGADCSFHFKKGEQYLVYAYAGTDKSLSATICSRTQLAAGAEALIHQLRAARDGKPVASLFGVLQRTQQPYTGAEIEHYDQPIRQTAVHLRSKNGKVFTAKTGDFGDYAFYDLPEGVYEVSADLPRTLVIAQTILSGPVPPLHLPAGTCFQYDIDAMPQARITGHLIGPDGRPVQGGVELFADKLYSQNSQSIGWWEFSGEKGFQFNRVAPGDYLLVLNNSNRADPDAPYPRTFYPGTSDLARASRIHVTENDREINADIHLPQPRDTRKLSVRLLWQGIKNPDFLVVHASGSEGTAPFAEQISPDHYELTLLMGVKYEIYASQICGYRVTENSSTPSGELFSSKFVLDPKSPATEITLVFPSGPCQLVVYPNLNQ